MEAAGEQDRVLGPGKGGKPLLSRSVLGEVATDQSRSRGASRPVAVGTESGAEAEVVVAAEAEDAAVVEGVLDPRAIADLGRGPTEVGRGEVGEGRVEAAVEGRWWKLA